MHPLSAVWILTNLPYYATDVPFEYRDSASQIICRYTSRMIPAAK